MLWSHICFDHAFFHLEMLFYFTFFEKKDKSYLKSFKLFRRKHLSCLCRGMFFLFPELMRLLTEHCTSTRTFDLAFGRRMRAATNLWSCCNKRFIHKHIECTSAGSDWVKRRWDAPWVISALWGNQKDHCWLIDWWIRTKTWFCQLFQSASKSLTECSQAGWRPSRHDLHYGFRLGLVFRRDLLKHLGCYSLWTLGIFMFF